MSGCKAMATAFGLIALGSGCGLMPTGDFTILSGEVTVTGRPIEDFPPWLIVFQITARHAREQFRWSTGVWGAGKPQDGIALLRKATAWKSGYLFVPESTGGGNAWRVSREHVLAIRAGHLVHLGEILAGEHGPGSGYEAGYFGDVYDKFELNELTDHASAPWFQVFSREKDGGLTVDLEYTWQQDAAQFAKTSAEIRGKTAPGSSPDWRRFVGADILSNAVLAKYCRRDAELKETMRIAEAELDAKQLRILNEILSRVVPGELPKWGGHRRDAGMRTRPIEIARPANG